MNNSTHFSPRHYAIATLKLIGKENIPALKAALKSGYDCCAGFAKLAGIPKETLQAELKAILL